MKKVLYIISLFLLSFAQAFGQTNSYTRADSIHLTNTTKTSVVLIDGKLRVLRATAGSGTDSVYSKGSDGYVHLIKVTTSGSFLPLAGGIMTGKQFFNTTASDSLGVWWGNGAHGVGSDRAGIYLSQPTTDHSLFTFHLDDNAHFDFFRWEINTNSSGGPADNHIAALLNLDKFDVKSDSVLLRNYLFFTAGITQNHTIVADSIQFDSQVTDGATSSDIGQTANSAGIGSNDIASGNSNSINSFAAFGGETGFSLQTVKGSGGDKEIYASTGTGAPDGILFHDSDGGIGPIADGSIDTANMTITPKMYVTSEWVLRHSGSSINLGNSNLTSTSGRTFNMNGHNLSFTYADGSGLLFTPSSADLIFNADGSVVQTGATNSTNTSQSFSVFSGGDISGTEPFLNQIVVSSGGQIKFDMEKTAGFGMSNTVDGLGANYLANIDTAASIVAFGGKFIPDKEYNDSHYAIIGGSGVISVSGTANRTTSTGGTTPVIDISSTFEGLLAKLAANNTFAGNNIFSSSLTLNGGANFAGNAANFTNAGNVGGISAGTLTAGRSYLLPDKNGTFAMTTDLATGANPTATATTTAVNGVATTFMRSDAAPKVDSTVFRTVANSYSLSGMATKLSNYALTSSLPVAGNPSGLLTFTAANGSNTTYERTDGLHAIDSTVVRSVANSYSLSGMATKLSNYGLLANPLSQFASTTSLQLLGVISDETGTGSLVFANTPTLVTPVLGVATATSINKVAITAPATSATLTIANGATLQQTGAFTLNLTATAASTPTFPTGSGTLPYLAGTNSWGGGNTFGGGLIVNTTQAMFNGGFNTSSTGGSNASNFFGTGGDTPSGNLTAAGIQILGSTNLNARAVSNGQTTATMGAGNSSAVFVIGSSPITKAASGTHPLVAGLAVRAPVINSGSATVTNSATAFFAGSPTGATNNYTLWAIGQSRISGIQVDTLTASKVVFTDANKRLTSTGIGTSSQLIAGDGSLLTNKNTGHTIFTPTTGGTVNLINNQTNIINPAGSLLALTVNFPSSPTNDDRVTIKFTQAVTTVTYGNGTVVDGITSPIAGGLAIFTYDSGTTSWY